MNKKIFGNNRRKTVKESIHFSAGRFTSFRYPPKGGGRSYRLFIVGILLLCLLLLGIVAMHFHLAASSSRNQQSTSSATESFASQATTVMEKRYAQATDWRLILVNRNNPLDEDFTVELATCPYGGQVDARILDDLCAMIEDAYADGVNPVIISSYRSLSYQETLYTSLVAKYVDNGYSQEDAETEASTQVALPGTSEHHTGLAVDIVDAFYTTLDEEQANTNTFQWLEEHCWEYGFIVRYPVDSTAITGIIYEPWHFRYVGTEVAAALHESGETLEEYLLRVELFDVN